MGFLYLWWILKKKNKRKKKQKQIPGEAVINKLEISASLYLLIERDKQTLNRLETVLIDRKNFRLEGIYYAKR